MFPVAGVEGGAGTVLNQLRKCFISCPVSGKENIKGAEPGATKSYTWMGKSLQLLGTAQVVKLCSQARAFFSKINGVVFINSRWKLTDWLVDRG